MKTMLFSTSQNLHVLSAYGGKNMRKHYKWSFLAGEVTQWEFQEPKLDLLYN